MAAQTNELASGTQPNVCALEHYVARRFQINIFEILKSGKDFYSDPVPESSKPQFRLKIIHRKTNEKKYWRLYITCWKPLSHRPTTIAYKVTLKSDYYRNSEYFIQQSYNEWMPFHVTDDMSVDRVSVKCELTIEDIIVPVDTEAAPSALSWVDDNGDHGTVTLLGADSSQLQVLKGALQGCSVVFSKMFDSQWKEGEEKTVKLQGLDKDGLRELRRYLYNSTPPETRAMPLFELANMYEMEDLKCSCAEVLYEQLTPDKAMDVMKVAALYKYGPLVRAVMLYFEEHYLDTFA